MEHHSYLIEIKDGIKTNSIRYSMNSDGRVYKIEEGFNGTYENMRYTNITYDLLISKTTIVSDYLGN